MNEKNSKRKDYVEKRYKSDMKKNMQDQYGRKNKTLICLQMKDDYKYNVNEEGLRDWFGNSSGTTKFKRGKRMVQVGGKYDGKPCARQPAQKSTLNMCHLLREDHRVRVKEIVLQERGGPKSTTESGVPKPTNVSTDPKRK